MPLLLLILFLSSTTFARVLSEWAVGGARGSCPKYATGIQFHSYVDWLQSARKICKDMKYDKDKAPFVLEESEQAQVICETMDYLTPEYNGPICVCKGIAKCVDNPIKIPPLNWREE